MVIREGGKVQDYLNTFAVVVGLLQRAEGDSRRRAGLGTGTSAVVFAHLRSTDRHTKVGELRAAGRTGWGISVRPTVPLTAG